MSGVQKGVLAALAAVVLLAAAVTAYQRGQPIRSGALPPLPQAPPIPTAVAEPAASPHPSPPISRPAPAARQRPAAPPVATTPTARTRPTTPVAASGGAPTAPLSLNTASLADLERLPGLSAKTAERIVQYRRQHPFRRSEELMLIQGVTPQEFEKLRPYVTP